MQTQKIQYTTNEQNNESSFIKKKDEEKTRFECQKAFDQFIG